jgi:hypothetical protein
MMNETPKKKNKIGRQGDHPPGGVPRKKFSQEEDDAIIEVCSVHIRVNYLLISRESRLMDGERGR